MSSIALYIHWPFCKSKCPYCDFNSHVRETIDQAQWLQGYITELEHFAPLIQGRQVASVFIGGGTPSLMPPATLGAILDKLAVLCDISETTEITLEANPTSVEAEKFKAFRAAGVNRVSLGVQALNKQDLAFLGREHSAEEAIRAITLAQGTFPRFSFDLIYARPGQTLGAWEKELLEALKLAGKHLSLYQLTIEKGTPFYRDHRKAAFMLPDEQTSAELYSLTQDIMESSGLPAYEISNHAEPGEECQHNLVYWRYGEYLGIGPGAHSRIQREDSKRHAVMMVHHPEHWLEAVATRGQGVQSDEALTQKEMAEEALMMGLRLREGINYKKFKAIVGCDIGEVIVAPRLSQLCNEGLLHHSETALMATPKGQLLLNSVVAALVI